MSDFTQEQLNRAADIAEKFVQADFNGNDIAGLRNGICADSAIEDFVREVSPPEPKVDGLAEELKALLAKATPGDLSTAKLVGKDETVECPLCGGQGEVEQDGHYTNFDGVALGVQFYGIGPHFGAHEALWSWLMKHHKTILSALKDRDVVLEEAAERAAFVAGYRAAHMVPDAYDSTSAAEEAWEGYRLVSRNLKERV